MHDVATIEAFSTQAIKWRFMPGGRSEGWVDCFGLIYLFAKSVGIALPDYAGMANPLVDGESRFLNDYHAFADEIGRDVLEPGDLILFRRRELLCHIGIYAGKDFFLHADRPGISRERLSAQPHCRQAAVFLRLRGADA